jgi:hypothetical protein
MRIIFGILSFCAAGLLAYHVVPVVRQIVIPYWLQGKSSGGFIQMQLGPFLLSEPQICILATVLALLVIALIVASLYAFTTQDTTA